VWEDGTGVEHVDGATPHTIDYYYISDEVTMKTSSDDEVVESEVEGSGSQSVGVEGVDTASFPPEWFGKRRRKSEEHVRQEEAQSEQAEEDEWEVDTVITVSAARMYSITCTLSSLLTIPSVALHRKKTRRTPVTSSGSPCLVCTARTA
jgi:hypothetical protein